MASSAERDDFERILQHLQQTRGFDFTAYKRPTLMRRVMRRMQTVNVGSFDEYHDYLQVHQEEFAALFDTVLINVTSFFRDPDVWEYLRTEVLPDLIAAKHDEPIRVWSAGCASGQEPYSISMCFAELLGTAALRDRVKIYATDADEHALAEGRAGSYPARSLAGLPEGFSSKYFEAAGPNCNVIRELRRAVIFGRHDLLQDAPISRVDLLFCRNTLMYFNADAQARILSRFFYSLNGGGTVVLGCAEMLFSHARMFAPVDLKRRIFRSVNTRPAGQRDPLALLAYASRETSAPPQPSTDSRLRQVVFETDSVAQIVLDASGIVAAANAPARHNFHLTMRDIGRPIQDLEVSYRPAEVRGAIEAAMKGERRDVKLRDIPWAVEGTLRHFDVLISPLLDDDRSLLGVRLSFHDVTHLKSLKAELQQSKQELETAYEELQSTNEELETTNEELQSTVEELETTNEELQSTNEELETMNEELQSTNEELQTMNDELRNRGLDLNAANAFLESVFTSLRSAVVVVDRDMRVVVWNDQARELWGLSAEETYQANFLALDIGLPVAELWQPMRHVLTGAAHRELITPATSRRGRSIECRLKISPLKTADHGVGGVIVMMEELTSERAV